jgi:polar amino acid transport system permease protein
VSPHPRRWFWHCVYALIIAALGASVYAVSQRVDYDWRWQRVPQYIVSHEGERVAAPADGIVRLGADPRALEIHRPVTSSRSARAMRRGRCWSACGSR